MEERRGKWLVFGKVQLCGSWFDVVRVLVRVVLCDENCVRVQVGLVRSETLKVYGMLGNFTY